MFTSIIFTGAFRCVTCLKYYPTKKKLQQHQKIHTRQACKVCGRPELNIRNMPAHLWTHKGPDEQNAMISSGENWKLPRSVRNTLGITGVQSWNCTICQEIFQTSADLLSHRNKIHFNNRQMRNKKYFYPNSKKSKVDCSSEEEDFTDTVTSDEEYQSDIEERLKPSASMQRKHFTRFSKFRNLISTLSM